jgi:hypothetical protein
MNGVLDYMMRDKELRQRERERPRQPGANRVPVGIRRGPPRRVTRVLIGLTVLLSTLLVPSLVRAGGWYLLHPVAGRDADGKERVWADTPVSSWEQEGAYATAEECEAKRLKLSREGQPYLARRPLPEGWSLWASYADWSRCIASDDPRLQPMPLPSPWYLLLPPESRDRPLREWDQVLSYASREACEAHRREIIERNSQNAREYLLGACVSSDDPRLK